MNLAPVSGCNLRPMGHAESTTGAFADSLAARRWREVIDGMGAPLRALFELISQELCQGIQAAGASAVRANHHPLGVAPGTTRVPRTSLTDLAADDSAHLSTDA
jgi:hypothetical protein